MVHGGGLDPHWFDQPSLVLYLLAPSQAGHAEPSYLAARLTVVVVALATVAAAWWLGQQAYGLLAGFVAAAATAVETTHVAYSRMAVTDVPLTLGVTVALVLMVTGRIELAGLLVGIAASAKLPALLLVVPLAAAGWGSWRRLAIGGGLAVVGFAATSPYLLLHSGEAADAARRSLEAVWTGSLGFEHDQVAPAAFVARLWDGLGPALVIAGAGLAVALLRRRRADLVLAVFVLTYFAALTVVHAHFDRYVLPLVPALGVLAGRFRSLAPVTILMLVVPLTWSVRDARDLTRTDTRILAQRWAASYLPRDASLAADPSTPDFAVRRVVRLALPQPGEPADPNRDVSRLAALGVQYVVVTGAVEDRVLAAAADYPEEARFLRELRQARRVYVKRPGTDLSGPWVEIYRL
jgi:4-amino-4-deoxy-L-arabinose transferase-like glycosyltransferase